MSNHDLNNATPSKSLFHTSVILHYVGLNSPLLPVLIKKEAVVVAVKDWTEDGPKGKAGSTEETQSQRDNNRPCLNNHQMATAWLAVSSILGPLVPIFN